MLIQTFCISVELTLLAVNVVTATCLGSLLNTPTATDNSRRPSFCMIHTSGMSLVAPSYDCSCTTAAPCYSLQPQGLR